MSSRPLLALFAAAACQFPQADETGPGPGPVSAVDLTATGSSTGDEPNGSTSPAETASTGGGSASQASAETGDDSSASIPDVGQSTDLGDGSPLGCQGKIDFLFVISYEGVMKDVEPQLVSSLPRFIATIQAKFADFDYHIMAIDSDKNWGQGFCNEECVDSGSCQWVADYPCDKLDLVSSCDQMIGAGNVFAAGYSSYNKPCAIADGKRYITRDQPDLAESFQCIAQIGIGGRGKMGEALATAMSTQLSGIGGCNDGFLRKDALLMVTLIGSWDEVGDPQYSAGTPEEWAQAIIDKKQGNVDAVVMLDIGDSTLPWQDRIWQLTKLFKYNMITDLSDTDYGPAFDAATDLALEACAGFVAPR